MANIVILENDKKIAAQMRQFFNDLDESHRLRSFSSLGEFEQVYLKKTHSDPTISEALHPLLQSFSHDQMAWLISNRFRSDSPFSQSVCRMTIDKDQNLIDVGQTTDTSALMFGKPPEEVIQVSFKDLVHPLFTQLWIDFFSSLKSDKVISTAMVFSLEKGSSWLLKVSGKKTTTGHYQVVLRFQPEVFDPMLKSLQLPQEEEGEEAEALQLLSTIDLVVFKIPMINKPIVAWLESTFTALQEGGFFPAEIPTRFVAVKYEDDGLETTKLLHPHLNDLIFLPLDRLVFLQKMEILLGLPGKIKPSYLFMQEHKMNIELAKLARMEKLSDVGCAIRNPTPLTQGVSVRFKFRLPNEEAFTIALARSYSSVAHPEKEGEFLVYFYFFGIDKDSLKNIKRYCNQKPKFRPLLEEDSSRFDFVAQNLFLTEQEKKMKTVVVLDPNPTASENITGIIESDFDRVLIKAENSYYIFLKDYLRDPSLQASKSDTPSGSGDTFALVTNNDLYAPSVSWIVASDSGNLVVLQSKAKEGDKILGYDAQDMFSTDQDWKKLFEGKDNENLLAESLTILSLSDQNLKKRFALSSESGQSMWTDVDFTPLNQPKGQVLITITPMENPDWKKKDDSTLNSLDLLVIHEDFIPENLENWYDHIQNLALQNRLCTMTDPFKIIVISEATKRSKEVQQKFRHSKVAGLLFKPLDLRSFLLQISVLTQCPFTKHNSENQNYLDVHIWAHLTKEVQLEGISEYGASIDYPTPIDPGTTLFLHEGIFDKAPDASLAAKFYHSEPHPKNKEGYTCSFVYFGINDAFLKFCRSWIRDNYAAKKSKES